MNSFIKMEYIFYSAGFRSGGNNQQQKQKMMALQRLSNDMLDKPTPVPEAKRETLGRGRGRGKFAASLKRRRGGLSAGKRQSNTLEGNKCISVVHNEDHADRLWSETMLSNLLHCGIVAEEKQKRKSLSPNKAPDFVELLYQEWKRIYPNSLMNSRNIKSRLSVYKKTLGDFPHPTKRRKIEPSSPPPAIKKEDDYDISHISVKSDNSKIHNSSASISLKEHFSSMLTKNHATSPVTTRETQQNSNIANIDTTVVKQELDLKENGEPFGAIKCQTAGLVDEVNDEFAPEGANGSSPSSISEQCKPTYPSDTTSFAETVKVEFVRDEGSLDLGGDSSSRSSPSLSRRVSVEQACANHWCHVFHDRDKEVECVLTQQLLDIRKQLEPQFPGCDIYSPRKPKGK